MRKKHFIALADYIRQYNCWHLTGETPFTDVQIELLARFCKSQSSAFNRERWLGYIRGENGPNGGKPARAFDTFEKV